MFGKEAGSTLFKVLAILSGMSPFFSSSLSIFFATSRTQQAGQQHSDDVVHNDDKTLESEFSRLMEFSTKQMVH